MPNLYSKVCNVNLADHFGLILIVPPVALANPTAFRASFRQPNFDLFIYVFGRLPITFPAIARSCFAPWLVRLRLWFPFRKWRCLPLPRSAYLFQLLFEPLYLMLEILCLLLEILCLLLDSFSFLAQLFVLLLKPRSCDATLCSLDGDSRFSLRLLIRSIPLSLIHLTMRH